jgi:formamidopyrimidine-DNA glycosylase
VPEGYQSFMEDIKRGECAVTDIQVKGKFMYWTFSNGQYMFCTFGMTGQWSQQKGKHPCFVFQHVSSLDKIQEYKELVFNDPRHFGTIKFTNNKQDLIDKINKLGWDPLSVSFNEHLSWLKQKLVKTNKSIAEAMMNQKIFAGSGNYIRAEALYLSRLNPFRPASTLTEDEIQKLCRSIVDIMQESYKHQGATIQTYKTVYGEEGKYSSCFKVYGQKKDPLGNPIIKQYSGGRTIHWCPTVQV